MYVFVLARGGGCGESRLAFADEPFARWPHVDGIRIAREAFDHARAARIAVAAGIVGIRNALCAWGFLRRFLRNVPITAGCRRLRQGRHLERASAHGIDERVDFFDR
jgi:hypothetical protein